MFALNVLMDII